MHATLIERKFDKASAEMLEEPTIRVSVVDNERRGISTWEFAHSMVGL